MQRPPLPFPNAPWPGVRAWGPGSTSPTPLPGAAWPGPPTRQSPPEHGLSSPGSPASSPWQLRPLGASRYPDEGQLHWKLPGTLMQR